MTSTYPFTSDPVVIVSAARTPMGAFQGALAPLAAPELGAIAISAAVQLSRVEAGEVDEVFMGNVLSAGLGQNPARQAALKGGLPEKTPSTTVSKVCGSGMKALMLAHDGLIAGSNRVVVAGGMESMTNAPYLSMKTRSGARLGHVELKDHMFLDGLEDAYSGRLMGTFAEDSAASYGIGREAQDTYARQSLERALAAEKSGAFAHEIIGISQGEGRNGVRLDHDEQPRKADPEKIARLKPAFREGGTVTAANASSISDGAAALVLMRESEARSRGLEPMARVLSHSGHARAPAHFTSAPVGAVETLLARIGWKAGQVDLWEINEAFAVVALIAIRELGLDREKVNIHGGACALGHPIGASGARIVVTLLHALKARGLKRGVASLCIGGGEATALAVELY
ncbi:thiolase family protein [Gellertiella hungarica]|uniref:Beta-ketothiolase n=1 Tax=Gellertiella hungarica TaxID=1572859 RepID=A0A7W6J923_9HYPH|nr:acetyl-CoA C-acyltransferase [Gellertiella hungarica]MBB4066186.1 acetyl-CoA C-acetyltransferase [Gellertiella hungarica]